MPLYNLLVVNKLFKIECIRYKNDKKKINKNMSQGKMESKNLLHYLTDNA